MLALLLPEVMAPKALARGLVTHATTVLTAGSVLPLKHRRNLLLVGLVGRVPIVKEAGFVLLSKLLDHAEALAHPRQEVLRQANRALLPPRKSQVGSIAVVGQTTQTRGLSTQTHSI